MDFENHIFVKDGQRVVNREKVVQTLMSRVSDLVDKEVSKDYRSGAILEYFQDTIELFPLASKYHVLLKERKDDWEDDFYYNCSFSDETDAKIAEYPDCDKKNWGVICHRESELLAVSDIDHYACKVWDACEEEATKALEKEINATIID